MRRALTVILLFIIVLGCGYGIYYYWDKQKSLDSWSLVPENTLLVYENNNLVNTWNDLQQNPVWQDLLNIPEIQSIKTKFEYLDSILGKKGELDNFFRNNRVLISMHLTAKDDFDFVFYQNFQNSEQVDIVKEVKEKLDFLKTNIRQYENYNIHELKDKNNVVVFSYIILRGNFVGSFSPILVEDVIRNLNKENEGFRQKNEDIFKIAKFQNDAGNFFINFNRLYKFSGIFTKLELDAPLMQILKSVSGSTFLDLIFDKDKLYFNGYTFLTDSNAYLKAFQNQAGGSFDIKNYIPNRAAYVVHERFDNPKNWMQEKLTFWSNSVDNYSIQRQQLGQKFKSDFTNFHTLLAGENGMAVLNSESSEKEADKLLFLKLDDVNEGLNEFNKLAEEAAQQNGDTLYYEFYADTEIRELAIKEFPYWLLGPNYKGFEHSYFILLDKYLVLSNQIQSLKTLIIDMNDENVWGRSVKFNQFIESSLQDANLSIYLNFNQSWPLLLPQLNEKWLGNLKDNEKTLRNLELIAIQFSKEEGRFYTNISIEHQKRKALDKLNNFNILFSKSINAPIISKPHVVKNYVSGRFETMVQDSTLLLSTIDSEGNLQWTKPLKSEIISEVYQVDYYKNSKIQYAFATKDHVHILDRNGVELEGFPLTFGTDSELKYFSVVDYDKSKNYRFLVSTDDGDIYLSDNEGKLLGDWNPLSLGDKLATEPRHIRIRSKDFMVALQQSGLINVMARNSSMKPNFPIGIDDRLTNNLFFEIGNTFKQSKIVTITNGGKLLKVSFEGKIEQQLQLYKPSKETIFKLIADANQRKYLIVRQDKNRVSILNAKGELLFDKDYLSQEEMTVQYYQFAADKELIVITDLAQQFSYLYTLDGTLINNQPIESDQEVAIIYYGQENTIHIYKNHLNTFEIIKLKL